MRMEEFETKIPTTPFEIEGCHSLREYVLKESFKDCGIDLKAYDREHPVHSHPNISLIYGDKKNVVGSVRLDRQFEHLVFKPTEIRLALFAIDPVFQSQGHGGKFFAGILRWCRFNGIEKIYTNSRLSSREFWLKQGFEESLWDEKLDDESEIQMVYQVMAQT